MTRGWFSCHTGELGSPTKTVTYRYDDADWGDLLTEYDGSAITYDQIGNPLSDGTRSYTWRHGRQLATLTENGTTWTNTYDADGMRVSRSNGTIAYSYIYSGSKLRQMTVGTDVLTFTYDAAGTPMSLSYNGTDYYYATNLQGDVVGILDSAGQQVVAYSYDAWGNILSTTGPMANTLGVHNPLRYRGYVYDPETALYYLQSRYYDPQIGRFINADSFAATGQGTLGNNMFAYCNNNPINKLDPTGMFWKKVGNWIKDRWNEAVSFTKKIFGAEASVVHDVKTETELVPPIINTLITVQTGIKTTETGSSHGDSSKPISVYAQARSDAYALSSAGLKVNINKFTLDFSHGLDNLGVTASVQKGNTITSFGVKGDMSRWKVGFEGAKTVVWDENLSVTQYTNVSITLVGVLLAYYFAMTGDTQPFARTATANAG